MQKKMLASKKFVTVTKMIKAQ